MQTAAQRRRCGRVICQDIRSSLGEVLDLSAGGARVRTRKRPPSEGADVKVVISSFAGDLHLTAKAVWVRAVTLGVWEIGLTFTGLTPDTLQSLTAVARASAHNEQLRRE